MVQLIDTHQHLILRDHFGYDWADGIAGLAGRELTFREYGVEANQATIDECAGLGVKGFRRILHVMPDGLSQTTTFLKNLLEIGRRGFSFDLCLRADQHEIGAAILRACPSQRFILDHCGNPDIAADAFDTWSRSLALLARSPHLAIKLSGIAVNARMDRQNDAGLHPYMERVVELFGVDRVVWVAIGLFALWQRVWQLDRNQHASSGQVEQ